MIDDRFLSGLWYDLADGTICQVIETENGVALATPDGDVYHEYTDPDDFMSDAGVDLRQIPQDAIDDPVEFYQEIVDYLYHRAVSGESFSTLPIDDEIGFKYARNQVEVSVA